MGRHRFGTPGDGCDGEKGGEREVTGTWSRTATRGRSTVGITLKEFARDGGARGWAPRNEEWERLGMLTVLLRERRGEGDNRSF